MFKIDLNDNLEFIMDKQAHLYVSFGLYYFFYTYTDDMILSICLTFLTGFVYEFEICVYVWYNFFIVYFSYIYENINKFSGPTL